MRQSVINLKAGSPPEGSVFIARPSKWGNPFHIGKDGSRAIVIEKYRQWILSNPELLSQLEELRGKTLVCHCAPKACHGDVLLDLLNPHPKLLSF
jgi:hypothetical protein